MAISARAATATWNGTGAGEASYWTNSTKWSASPYPGSGAGETANINVSTANTYTNILDATLANALTALNLNNAGGGNAVLVVTNGAIPVTTPTLGIRGQLIIDNGGVVTNTGALSVGTGSGSTAASLIATNGGRFIKTGGLVNIGASTTGTAGGGDNMVILSNSVLTGSFMIGNASSRNTLTLLGNSVWNSGGYIYTGYQGATNNLVTITGGSILSNVVTGLGIGGYRQDSGAINLVSNRWVVTDGGVITNVTGLLAIGDRTGDSYNSLTVANGGRFFMNGTTVTVGGYGGNNNSLVLSNSIVKSTLLELGYSTAPSASGGGSGNTLTLYRDTVWNVSNGGVTAGRGTAVGNVMTVDGAVVTNVGALDVGRETGAVSNRLVIANGGVVSNVTGFSVGINAGGNFNSLITTNGGRLIMSSGKVLIGANLINPFTGGSDNTVILSDSVLVNGSGNYLFMGASSSRNTLTLLGNSVWDYSNQDVYLGYGLGGSSTGNVVTITGGYTFNTGLGATNYYRLEMVEGTTAVSGANPLTIGANGSMMVSNTTATISGAVTNLGTMDVLGDRLNCSSGLTLGAGSTTRFGLTATTSGCVNVTGTLIAGGTLAVTNVTGFTWTTNSWNLIDWSGGPISFAATDLPVLESRLSWDTSALATTGVLAIRATEAGTLFQFF